MRARVLARHWIHLVLGGALLMPYFLLASVFVPLFDGSPGLLTDPAWYLAFGGALPVAFLSAATVFFPVVRMVETVTAKALCGLPDSGPDDVTAASWAVRRRTAAWFTLHLFTGGIVSGMTLSSPPAAVVLMLLPFSERLRHSPMPFAEPFTGWLGPPAGLALLALLLVTVRVCGAVQTRCAPALLGPTPADRLAAAERRTADLATRNRLARELHDSVGHALSAVTLQASAARRVLESDPAFARQALAAIEETTREAVAELDTVLGLLREEDGGDPAEPAPTLDGLEALLGRTRAAGVAVEVTVEGRCTGLPPVVSREAYRIVQEGLSNALRHAGPVPVRLHVHRTERELVLRMTNPLSLLADGETMDGVTGGARDGAAQEALHDATGDIATGVRGPAVPAPRVGGGRGLRGIAERTRLLGGAATAGARGGIWQLTARLPLAGAETGSGTGTGAEAGTGAGAGTGAEGEAGAEREAGTGAGTGGRSTRGVRVSGRQAVRSARTRGSTRMARGTGSDHSDHSDHSAGR
ncbi:histidine kinase [Streptomyces sp. NPDC020742]|uniref:sensor histidine kinase n=1 Tax=Streptomyces sp. NPDC020742 TaxID=3154897 RepID=UPI00340F2207